MIYLDSAATTFQKPPQVAAAVNAAMFRASSPGRGGHRFGKEAARIAYSCREAAANLFRMPNPEQVIFTFNATHGLNIAIHSLVKPGSRVVISGYEHNAVTRPLYAIDNVEIRIVSAAPFDTAGMLQAFQHEINSGADVVICTHVSNVFGFILPVREIAALCRQRQIPLIIDASQSAGCVPIDFTALGAEFVAMPGHKGLYGPQGTGLLLCRKDALPLIYGGTGSVSALQEMPDFLPDRLEAGTPNIPGIAGLDAGIKFVSAMGVSRIGQHEKKLIQMLGTQLKRSPEIEVFLSDNIDTQSGVLSFAVDGVDCERAGEWLNRHGIAVRAGLHCAPIAHKSAGTLERGTIRASVSCFTSRDEIRQTIGRIHQLLKIR